MDKVKYTILSLSLVLVSSKAYSNNVENFLDLRANSISISKDIEYLLNKRDNNYDIPTVSGEVNNMPWKNDKDFLKAKEENNTPTLMTGFCAVLKNPLPGEEYNVGLACKKIKGQIIKSSDIFSQNMAIGPYTKLRGFKEGASYIGGNIIMTEGGGVCKIATTLYNLVVLSNLDVVERHNHSMPINYVPYGQDATVAYGVKDFKFKNTTENTILIWSEMVGNRLYMGFYASEKPPKVTWNHEITNVVKPSVKYIKNESLNSGEMKTILDGMDGATVNSTITIFYSDEHYIIKNMGLSHYSPLPRIIETN